ncbi:MAG: serine/threonine protein phosphatase, partial [Alphaproteobacteria bacterium]
AFLSSDVDFGRIVVHGHSVTPTPDVHHNRIGIDTGAYATGTLTALVLEGAERRFLATGDMRS